MIIFLLLALIIAIIAVVFSLQNNTTETITFLFWETEGSLALILLLSFAIGVITALLMVTPRLIRSRMLIASLNKKLKAQEISAPEEKADQPAAASPDAADSDDFTSDDTQSQGSSKL